MRPEDILALSPAGLCCKRGAFHVDPTRPVERALITHAHSDHARAGHGAVLATQETLDLMRLRYGENFAGTTQAIRYGESVKLDGVTATFHPAGHILGSAQIAVEANGLRIVASGDYKNVVDPTCAPFELVPCDVFITEATFALPVFRHADPGAEIAKLLRSVALFPDRAHLVGAYSLGKAQRLIALLRQAGYDSPIYLHGAMEKITRYYEGRGVALGELRLARGRHYHHLSALGLERSLDAAFPRPAQRLRVRLDARAGAGASTGRGAAAGHFRPRRLGRPHRDRCGDWRRRNLGHARPGRCAGALVRHARSRSAPARHRGLRR
jgi:DNA ligase-associated putative exonuclease